MCLKDTFLKAVHGVWKAWLSSTITRDWPWVTGSAGSGAWNMVPALPSALTPDVVIGQAIDTGNSQSAGAIDLLSDKEKRRLVREW